MMKLDMNKMACTTMIVGKNATTDGSVIVSHSDDDVSDARIVLVPRQKGGKNTMRPVYYDNCSLGSNTDFNATDIRRYIGTSRGPVYNTKDYENSKALGEIPQLEETYAYYDACYGIMNEHNLMIGECTCGSKVETEPEINKRIFYSAELSRVALERCKTAREAIELIGELMFTYGYYGTGETLLLGDVNEAWVMEMCSYSTENVDAVWAAQKVPDDQFFVAANEFRIRDIYINPQDKKEITNKPLYFNAFDENGKEDPTLLYSANLFKACANSGWIASDATYLDWLPTVSFGEYGHPYYSLRRVWRALSKANPTLDLPAKVEDGYTRAYPFSIKPSRKLSVLDIASIYRDHYEGTEFDLTKGLAAGPDGCPVRYDDNPDLSTGPLKKLEGAWERPLSIYRCAMMWINQAKIVGDTQIGISWNGLDRPFSSCLMPLLSNMNKIPSLLETMNLLDFKFQGDSAWWAFNFVGNYINLNYRHMIEDMKVPQAELESEAHTVIQSYLSKDVFDHHDHTKLKDFCTEHVYTTVNIWWELATSLVVKYNDGCLTTGPNNIMEPIKYPKAWLKAVGYYEGPTQY